MHNPITYIKTKKSFVPTKKLKYATGLGDIISAILHSKLVGPITYMFTGKLEPCATCNSRRVILNQLFPIEIWSYFFNTYDDVQEDIRKEYKKCGIEYLYISPDHKNSDSITIKTPVPPSLKDHPAYKKDGYRLIDEKHSIIDDTIVETFIYKKI